MTITKRDLVIKISEEIGLTQREVLEVIEQLMLEVTESLTAGENVVLRNFGTFQTAINKPKVGRNPKDPAKDIVIPARRVVRFRSGKILTDRVRNS